MKNVFNLTCFALLLSSCSSMPGNTSVEKSDYDKTVQVKMAPGWASTSFGSLKIGFMKNSKLAGGEVIMIVRQDSIKHFSLSGANFFMKIDGIEKSFIPMDKKTECIVAGPHDGDVSHCYQEYLVQRNLLNEIQHSKDIKLKLNLNGNTYVESDMNSSGPTTARSGIEDFIKEVEKQGLN